MLIMFGMVLYASFGNRTSMFVWIFNANRVKKTLLLTKCLDGGLFALVAMSVVSVWGSLTVKRIFMVLRFVNGNGNKLRMPLFTASTLNL